MTRNHLMDDWDADAAITAAERLELAEQEASMFLAQATKHQKAEFDATMEYIRPWMGSPRWERDRQAARVIWHQSTAQARDLFKRTVDEILRDGEVGEELDQEWTLLIQQQDHSYQVMREAAE